MPIFAKAPDPEDDVRDRVPQPDQSTACSGTCRTGDYEGVVDGETDEAGAGGGDHDAQPELIQLADDREAAPRTTGRRAPG
jgi:hypothetical protein